MSAGRQIGKKLLLAGGSFLFMLLLCELVGSLYSAWYYPRLTVTDPILGWKYKPTPDAVERRDQGADVNRLFINSDGFRDDEFSAAEDLLRIMVLGDSMTFGLEADQDEIYPELLERSLRERAGDDAIDVMNLGITGFGTAQELLALEQYAPLYPPRAVLLTLFELNDFENNISIFANRFVPHFVPEGDRLVLVDRPDAWQRTKNLLRDHSTLFFLFTHKFALTRGALRESLDLDRQQALQLTVAILGRMHDYLERRGVPFWLFYVRDDRLPADGIEAVGGFARASGIPFRALPLQDEQRVGGEGHWNAEGHAAAAVQIEDELLRHPDFRALLGESPGAEADG